MDDFTFFLLILIFFKMNSLEIYIFKPVLFISIAILFFACASTNETSKSEKNMQIDTIVVSPSNQLSINLKKELTNFEFLGEVTIYINNDEMSGNIEGGYIDNNKIIINVYGPFGIHFAAIEVKQDTIKVANIWHKRYYKSIVNIKSNELKLSLLELTRKILIAEPFIEKVILDSKKDTLVFQNTFSNGSIGYNYILSNNNLNFTKLIIENYDVKLKYTKYKKINSIYYPMNIIVQTENPKLKLEFQFEELKVLKDLNKYKSIDYNKLEQVDDINKLAK